MFTCSNLSYNSFKHLSCGVADKMKPQIIPLSQEHPGRITVTCLLKLISSEGSVGFSYCVKNDFIY